ncbi:MAG: DUF1343 domain-containing protein [Myxococcota bacterium]
MLAWIPSLFAAAMAMAPDIAFTWPAPNPDAPAVTLGIDVLADEKLDLLKGKKIGLLTHPAGVDSHWVPTVDRLVALGKAHDFKVVQLYGPEHGIRGYMSPGERQKDAVDPHTKIPVESLFGLGKRGRPSKSSLDRIDVLVVDLQDLGSRTYTYVSTLGEVMEAAKEAGKPVIVLDRPNPYGGLVFEGPVREKGFKSFIGWGPFPVTHGMTIGEVARFYNEVVGIGCDLTVIPMKGWRRSMTWVDTGLQWVPTSPAVPHIENAWLYTATGMLAGVSENVSEGVGTTLPFEQIGAEWIEAPKLEKELESRHLPGVRFRAVTYRPASFKFREKVLHGVQIGITDPSAFRPIKVALALMTALEKLWPGQAEYDEEFTVARVWGNTRVLAMVKGKKSADAIEATFAKDLEAFAADRAKVLLYP